MSGGHFHVHGAHDHEVEHKASKGGMAQTVALFSAILATVGAIVSFLGGDTQNEALYFKNEAVLKRAEASDQWNFYQAKSMKQNLAELSLSLSTEPAKIEEYKKKIARYDSEKAEIKVMAEKYENESKSANVKSEKALHPHHWLSISMTFLQIAIALASITVLTEKRWLLWGAAGAALAGVGLGLGAYIH